MKIGDRVRVIVTDDTDTIVGVITENEGVRYRVELDLTASAKTPGRRIVFDEPAFATLPEDEITPWY